MIITTINGSPKPKESSSEKYIDAVIGQLDGNNSINKYTVARKCLSEEAVLKVLRSDILLLAFPLYVDGIPANMLNQLIILEEAFKKNEHADTVVYVISNNGFYEGEQNVNAIEMVQHFCKRANLRFGQGVGIGTGEMNGQMIGKGMPIGKAVLKNLGDALNVFTQNIKERQSGNALYVRPNFSWTGFLIMGDYTFWRPKAKANGLSSKDMKRKLQYKKI